jgi:hypothetical protein
MPHRYAQIYLFDLHFTSSLVHDRMIVAFKTCFFGLILALANGKLQFLTYYATFYFMKLFFRPNVIPPSKYLPE